MNSFLTPDPSRRRFLGLLALVSLAAGSAAAQQLSQIGLTAASAQLHQESGSYPHSPGAADLFGSAIAVGDFNQDGYDDLATGIPGNDCDFVLWDCGAVQVRFGGASGPLGAFVTLDPRDEAAPDPATELDEYGQTLASGDFDGDGYADLAVGIPANFGSRSGWTGRPGGVQIHYGRHGSLGSIEMAARHFLQQSRDGVPSVAWGEERFGAALAVGDFDCNGRDDLAIGAPRDWSDGLGFRAGDVIVAHGGESGLEPFVGFEMYLGLQGLPEAREALEEFGYALAAGDFDGDQCDDLAIGVPSEDDVGAVLVVYGSPFSLIFANHWYFSQWDLNSTTQAGERFGASLAAGDFDGDGRDDLAIGLPRFDGEGNREDMGLLSVVYGSQDGLGPGRVHWLWEDLLYGVGHSEAFDNFARALAVGDFNGDGVEDLAIGTSGEDSNLTDQANTGAVDVVLGRAQAGLLGSTVRKLFPTGDPLLAYPFHDRTGLIPDYRGGGPFWGFALAAGDFDGNGFSDLAIGARSRDVLDQSPALTDSGAVAVVYGQLFLDGFETGDAREWSALVP